MLLISDQYIYHMETNSTSVVADNPMIKNHSTAASDDYDFMKGVKYLVDSHPSGLKKLPPEFVLPMLTNPLSVAHADVPVIDISGLTGPPESRISTVKAISSACASWGFFRIVNHGIEVGLMEEMIKVAEEFFDLSLAEKMRYASDDVMNPVRYGTSLNTSKKHSLHWRDYLRHRGHPSHSCPDKPPNYRSVANEYFEQLWELSCKLGRAMSEGLGLDPGYIDETLLGDGLQIIAVNCYPSCPEPDKTLGLAAHSDIGVLTIVMDNGIEGLQIKHEGTWVAVDHVPATFVVNLGDCLEVLTNGKYKSVEHRATVNAEKTRISVAAGHGPNLSKWMEPARELVDEGGFRYRPIAYSDYRMLQLNATTGGKIGLESIRIKTQASPDSSVVNKIN